MMRKSILFVIMFVALPASAQQWSKADSIRLDKLLKSEADIELNNGMPVHIDFGGDAMFGSPMQQVEKPWLSADETLPSAIDGQKPLNKKVVLTLHPYKPNTPYNWDPVREKKIKVGRDTWRSEPYYALTSLKIYSNWAKTPLAPGKRESVDQIEASGLRYNPFSQMANGKMNGSWEFTKGPSGHDFSAPFTKEFWDVKGRKRRERTLLVLSHYGDSTTVAINKPVIDITQQ
jgi:hypothetical protein